MSPHCIRRTRIRDRLFEYHVIANLGHPTSNGKWSGLPEQVGISKLDDKLDTFLTLAAEMIDDTSERPVLHVIHHGRRSGWPDEDRGLLPYQKRLPCVFVGLVERFRIAVEVSE